MEKRIEMLEKAVETLEAAISGQERRIAALEATRDASAMLAEEVVEGGRPSAEVLSDQLSLAAFRGTPALVGRSLLILAGAFLLRALTEAGTWANGMGVALGLVYAGAWIAAAAMAATKGTRGSAGFFAVCAALIADPLLFEATTEFGVLRPTGSALILAFVTAAGLAVASRWRLHVSAWVFIIGATVTAATLAAVRPPGEAATGVLVAVGIAALWLAGAHGWESLRWLTAIAANVGVLRLTTMATAPAGTGAALNPPSAPLVAVLQATLLVCYVGSSWVRSLRGRKQLRIFDYLQSAAAWAIGWGGAVQLARANDVGTRALGVLALVVGLASYTAAFGVVERRQGRNRSFHFMCTVGLVLVVLGLPNVVGAATAPIWAVIALIAAAAGSHWDRVTLRAHAAVLLLAAWVMSGVAVETAAELGGRADPGALPGAAAIIVAILTVITTMIVLVARRIRTGGWAQRLPLTVLLVMSGLVLAVTLVWFAEWMAPGSASWMGTVALSLVTIGLAVLASRWTVEEAGWVVYPLLALTGGRVIVVDLVSGRTVVFVIALAAYGAALIMSPRLLRTSRTRTAD